MIRKLMNDEEKLTFMFTKLASPELKIVDNDSRWDKISYEIDANDLVKYKNDLKIIMMEDPEQSIRGAAAEKYVEIENDLILLTKYLDSVINSDDGSVAEPLVNKITDLITKDDIALEELLIEALKNKYYAAAKGLAVIKSEKGTEVIIKALSKAKYEDHFEILLPALETLYVEYPSKKIKSAFIKLLKQEYKGEYSIGDHVIEHIKNIFTIEDKDVLLVLMNLLKDAEMHNQGNWDEANSALEKITKHSVNPKNLSYAEFYVSNDLSGGEDNLKQLYEKICKLIKIEPKDNHIIRDLNGIIETSNLYEIIMTEGVPLDLDKEMLELMELTKEDRRSGKSIWKMPYTQSLSIRRLNRLILKKLYPDLCTDSINLYNAWNDWFQHSN